MFCGTLSAGEVFFLAFSPNGNTLGADGAELWDMANRRQIVTLPAGPVTSVAFSLTMVLHGLGHLFGGQPRPVLVLPN